MTMRMKAVVVSVGLLCLTTSLRADDHGEKGETIPQVSIFGGYSLARDEGVNYHGWSANAQLNLSKWLALGVETSGHYKTEHGASITKNSYMAGPRFSFRRGKVVPFVYGLVGKERTKGEIEVSHVGISATESETAFAIGGGFDIELSHRWAIAIEGDELMVKSHGETHRTPRFSAGLVLNLGQK